MLLSTSDSDMDHQNERYMTIIKKAQNALKSSSRRFESPRILQKFLSTRESSNSQGKLFVFTFYFYFLKFMCELFKKSTNLAIDQSRDQSFTSPRKDANRSLGETHNCEAGKPNRFGKGAKLSLFAKEKFSCLSKG